jgi:hypothetical protein
MHSPTNVVHAGTFNILDMHTWLSRLLPDMPPSAYGSDEMVLAFTNVLLGTQLTCRYAGQLSIAI